VAQSFGQIIAELTHMDRHLVKWRWTVSADLDVQVAKPPGPLRVEVSCQAPMALAQPFGGDGDLVWLDLQNLVVDGDERDGEPI